MSKEVVRYVLIVVFSTSYLIVLLYFIYDWWNTPDEDKRESGSLGCAFLMVIIPLMAYGIYWYIQLPDRILR
jgi:hypothetical protein